MGDTIHIQGEAGTVFELSLPVHETIAEKLAKGSIRRVNADGTPYTEPSGDVPAPPTTRPAISAAKAEWVAWGVVQGLSPDDADALTKADLIERFGASAQDAPATIPETPDASAEGKTPEIPAE